MKKTIFILAMATFVVGSVSMGCKPNTEKEQAAQESVDSVNVAVTEKENNLDEAKRAATAEEWQAFKDDTNAKIEANNARIADLKLKIKEKGKYIDKAYQQSIDTMEQKNEELKVKLAVYKNDLNSDWKSFKREINHDMDQLGTSLKDFTVNNKK